MARWRAVPTYHSPSVRGVCDTQTALYGDFLYMLGVFSYDCNATWKFDVGESRWSEVARHQPRCRTTSPAAVYSERMYIFGGRSGDAFSQNVDAFDFKTERWSEVMTGGARPSARDGCARAVSREGVLFVFGGLGCSGVLGDMYELNLDTLVWTATDQQGSVPSAREGASWVRHRNCIYLFGGWDGEKYFGDFFCFEISSRSWSWVETCPRPALPLTDSDPSPSPGVAAAAEKAWPEAPESVAGSAGSAETSVISGAPSPRYRHAAVAHRHCLYIFGGCGGEGLLNDLYVFNFDAHRWHAVRCSDVPSPRMPMGAHVYKNTLYTVGGNSTYCGVPDVFQCDLEGVLVPPSAFMTVLNSFLAPPYSDVTFVVEGEKRLYGCKAILMARSEHFRAMFNSEMREKKLAGGGQPIRIGDISYRVMAALLQYLHTDTIHGLLSWEDTLQLMVAAERFGVCALKWLCVDCLGRMLNVENVAEVLIAAHVYSVENLKEICFEFLWEHEDTIKERDTLRPLILHAGLLFEVLLRCTPWKPAHYGLFVPMRDSTDLYGS